MIERTPVTVVVLLVCVLTGCTGDRQAGGVRGGRLADCPATPNCVSSTAVDDQHRLEPLPVPGDPDKAFATLGGILAGRNDARIIESRPGYLHVELRTTFFTDDAEFLLDRAAGVIQVRSASRVGYSDLGKNRSRMEEIRRQLAAGGAATGTTAP